MSILAEVGAYLVAQGLGEINVSLFLGTMPPDQGDEAVITSVREYPGLEGVMGFGTPDIKEETPAIQLVFRGKPHDYAGPRAKAEQVYQALARVQAEQLSGTFIHWIHPRQPPSDILGRDDNERVRISFNCLVEKEPSAA